MHWLIAPEILRELLSDEFYKRSRERVQRVFASGHGTVLFFEDEEVVTELQRIYPTSADYFPHGRSKPPPCKSWLSGRCM